MSASTAMPAFLNALPVRSLAKTTYRMTKKHFLEINEELAQVWPQISDQKDPLPDADDWLDVDGKLKHLIKTPPDENQ